MNFSTALRQPIFISFERGINVLEVITASAHFMAVMSDVQSAIAKNILSIGTIRAAS